MQSNYQINLKSMLAGGSTFKKSILGYLLLIFIFPSFCFGLKVDKIFFEGNKSFSASELKEILKTQEKKEFDAKILRIDKTILNNFYLSNGFLDIWIETNLDRRGEKISIEFQIAEGTRYLLGTIEFAGATIISEERLRNFFEIKDTSFYQINKIDEGLNKIEEYYYNNGKPYVELTINQRKEVSFIFIEVNIQENETVYIYDIDYIGLQKVKRFVVGRELEISKNEMYSRKKIEKSQRNIYSTGLFDFVGMELKTVDTTRSKALLLVKLVEKEARWIGMRFGIGYEQDIVYGGTFDYTLEFGHRNLFGTARSIFLSITPSFSYDFEEGKFHNPKNQYSLTYIEPWIGYTRTPGIFRISFIQVRPLYSANYDYLTTSFLVQHEFENFWKISSTLAYNQVKFAQQDTLDEDLFSLTGGQDYIYSLSGQLTRDKRNNFLNPQRGSLTDIGLRFAYSRSRDNRTGETVNHRFIRAVFEWNRYQPYPVYEKWVMATRIKIGNIFDLGNNLPVPISERFFLGGASTVRGYREQLLGPVLYEENGKNPKAIGGKLMVLANIELRIPLFWIIWGEVFFDAGNVWLETNNFIFKEIKTTMGLGLAFLTPFGPIRFDYGIKHNPVEYESDGQFHISIAFAF
jgi:outer membrane protein insertion porin family